MGLRGEALTPYQLEHPTNLSRAVSLWIYRCLALALLHLFRCHSPDIAILHSLIFFVSFFALSTYSFALAAAGKDSQTKPNVHSSLWVEMGVIENLIIQVLIQNPTHNSS